jgi:hypothetical protein
MYLPVLTRRTPPCPPVVDNTDKRSSCGTPGGAVDYRRALASLEQLWQQGVLLPEVWSQLGPGYTGCCWWLAVMACCRLAAVDCCVLAAGRWPLAAACWPLAAACWPLAAHSPAPPPPTPPHHRRWCRPWSCTSSTRRRVG